MKRHAIPAILVGVVIGIAVGIGVYSSCLCTDAFDSWCGSSFSGAFPISISG